MLSSDPELYKIALRGNEDLSSLDPWEQQRFAIWCLHETGMWEMCHRLLNQGALDEALYRGKESYWLQLHSSPGRREWWNTQSIMLNEEFYREVSNRLEAIRCASLGRLFRSSIPVITTSAHSARRPTRRCS